MWFGGDQSGRDKHTFYQAKLPAEVGLDCNAEMGQKHRIIVGWATDRWKVHVLLVDPQVIYLHCTNFSSNKDFLISFIYGKNRESERCHLWSILESSSSLVNNPTTPWLVLGDFNAIRSSTKKVGGRHVISSWNDRFNSCIFNSGLVDLNTKGA